MFVDSSIDDAVTAALGVLRKPDGLLALDRTHCTVRSWPQTWPSTTCGRGGIGGRAMTTAQTVVVVGPMGDAAVYHAGHLARHVRAPSKAFWLASRKEQMPGAADRWSGMDLDE